MKLSAIAIPVLAACSAFATTAQAEGLGMLGSVTATPSPTPSAPGANGSPLSLDTLARITSVLALPGSAPGDDEDAQNPPRPTPVTDGMPDGSGEPPDTAELTGRLPDLEAIRPDGGGSGSGSFSSDGSYNLNVRFSGGSTSGEATLNNSP